MERTYPSISIIGMFLVNFSGLVKNLEIIFSVGRKLLLWVRLDIIMGMKNISVIILLLMPGFVLAQDFNFMFEPDSIPVEINGWQPFCPWTGGMGKSNPDIIDLDADGDFDIFITSGDCFSYFCNVGTQSVPDFKFMIEITESLETEGNNTVDLCDVDNDNDYDLFVGSDERIWFWENIGNAQSPQFNLVTDSLEQVVTWASFLDFVDIDADNDYDLFTAHYGGTISFYLNEGTADSFYFVPEELNFLQVTNDAADPTFVDIDADGDFDLFVGEEYGEIWYFRNDGDSANYNFTFVTDNYCGIDAGKYASPEFADIDGDGDYDLFVGRESTGVSQYGDVFFYENIGTPENAQFEYVTSNYLVFDISNSSCRIQMVDINGDEAVDLIIGTESDLHYFQNTGSSTEPSFTFIDDEFQDVHELGLKPCFVDLDSDGDYDLLAGEGIIPGPPQVGLYVNHGTSGNPDLQLTDPNYITNTSFFVNTFPGTADIDADGDYDLFVTSDNGNFYFYRNDGTVYSPDFVLNSTQWQNIQFPYAMWRGFHFADIDNDSDLDLLIANVWQEEDFGNLRLYRNIGSPTNPNMVFETNNFLPETEIITACPFSVDIDSDGDLDLFAGEGAGGIKFFRNWGDSTGVTDRGNVSPFTFTLQQNYPNPFNAQTMIPFTLDRAGKVNLRVYDVLGRRVWGLGYRVWEAGPHEVVWNAEGVASGVYLVRLSLLSTAESRQHMPLFHQTRKVVLVK